MPEEIFYLLFLLIILGSPFCGANDCDGADGVSLFCKRIDTFPDEYYPGFRNVYCENCLMETFTADTFPYNNRLEYFQLTNSSLKSIDAQAFIYLHTLSNLHLENNMIENISPQAFTELTQLNELHLEHNCLATLPRGIFEGISSSLVNVSHNNITYIDLEAFKGSNVLFVLDLSYNQLNQLFSRTFDYMSDLRELNLSYNKLCGLPMGAFKHLKFLKHLNLSNNKIKLLHPGNFAGLLNLEEIVLANNSLSTFDSEFTLSMPRLQVLDISANGIQNFPNEFFNNYLQLTRISFEDNRFNCNYLKRVLRFFKLKGVDVIYKDGRAEYQNVHGIACSDYIDFIDTSNWNQDFLQAAQQEGALWNSYC